MSMKSFGEVLREAWRQVAAGFEAEEVFSYWDKDGFHRVLCIGMRRRGEQPGEGHIADVNVMNLVHADDPAEVMREAMRDRLAEGDE